MVENCARKIIRYFISGCDQRVGNVREEEKMAAERNKNNLRVNYNQLSKLASQYDNNDRKLCLNND